MFEIKRDNLNDTTFNNLQLNSLISDLRAETLASMSLVVTTYKQAIRPSFSDRFKLIFFVKDKDLTSLSVNFIALLAAFSLFRFGKLVGNPRQKGPYVL